MTEMAHEVDNRLRVANPSRGIESIATTPAPRCSTVAEELTGSQILTIAAEVRALAATGRPLCNLTVGDFSPSEFRIPRSLEDGVVAALRAGQTNYPPSDGIEKLRETIRDFYARRLKLVYPQSGILVTSGARPAIYAAYRVLVNPGDRVVFPVPSWNNNYYCQLLGAEQVTVNCGASTNFQPTATLLRHTLRDARLLALNSPLNPTGTIFDAETLTDICQAVLEENERREAFGERPLYVMYDQVYWMLTFGGAKHVNPVSLCPEMEKYTVLIDAISKSFAATGLRVGWAVGPTDVVKRMSDIVCHVGAWAPRPEQMATAALLADDAGIDEYHALMLRDVQTRLDALASGLAGLRDAGLPVETTAPQGAMYLSARFALAGRRAPAGDVLRTNEEVRRYLLHEAGLAAVQFQAFGSQEETGWFRLSAGAVSPRDIEALIPRVRTALEKLGR